VSTSFGQSFRSTLVIRTTMDIQGDAASAHMCEAHGKIVQLALQSE
jgi:hypothetical protein